MQIKSQTNFLLTHILFYTVNVVRPSTGEVKYSGKCPSWPTFPYIAGTIWRAVIVQGFKFSFGLLIT